MTWKNVQRGNIAGFEAGKWGSQAKECGWPLLARKARKQVLS